MKRLWILLLAAGITLTKASGGAQTANATLFCWSLRFNQGQGSFDETLDLSSISGTPNGELAAWFDVYTHRSGFILDYSGFPITGTIYLDLPPYQDANGNGFDDSFEVSQAISGSSVGEYVTVIGGGTVSAFWNRAAGSRFGSCTLHLVDDNYGDLGNYHHTFEVLEYKGPLDYIPGSTSVSASLNVTNDTGQIAGPATFTKSMADPHNALTMINVSWTNSAAQMLSLFFPSDVARDSVLLTNYYGLVDFNDGDPSTLEEDYYTWEISIDDPNDADHDTIPDFSDEPQAMLPRAPSLTLTLGTTNLWLNISGDVQHVHRILEATSFVSGNWTTNQSFVLTNDPQTISLPLPSGTGFWRVLAE